jgi:hypothetical protein
VADHPVPVWRDPLLQDVRPTGTGSGAYVEQPEPRANPMTIEGEIAALGQMARGAVRRGGWTATLTRVAIVSGLVWTLVSSIYFAMRAFR